MKLAEQRKTEAPSTAGAMFRVLRDVLSAWAIRKTDKHFGLSLKQ